MNFAPVTDSYESLLHPYHSSRQTRIAILCGTTVFVVISSTVRVIVLSFFHSIRFVFVLDFRMVSEVGFLPLDWEKALTVGFIIVLFFNSLLLSWFHFYHHRFLSDVILCIYHIPCEVWHNGLWSVWQIWVERSNWIIPSSCCTMKGKRVQVIGITFLSS